MIKFKNDIILKYCQINKVKFIQISDRITSIFIKICVNLYLLIAFWLNLIIINPNNWLINAKYRDFWDKNPAYIAAKLKCQISWSKIKPNVLK